MEVIRLQVTRFQMIAGSSLIFFIHMKYVLFLGRTTKILTDLGPENSAAITGKTVAFDFAHHGHALVTLYIHF